MGGEALIGLKPAFCYFDKCSYSEVNITQLVPGSWNETETVTEMAMTQLFPFKTFSMLMSFATVIIVSYPIKFIFEKGLLPKHMDVFECVVNISEESIALRETLYDMNGDSHGAGHVGKRDAVAAMHSNINPALKFSRDDLLNVSESKQPLAPSPVEDDPPTKYHGGP